MVTRKPKGTQARRQCFSYPPELDKVISEMKSRKAVSKEVCKLLAKEHGISIKAT